MHQSLREISYGTCITHWENMIRIIFATEPAWIFPKAHLKLSQDSLIGHPSSSNYPEEYTRDARYCFLEIPLPLTVPFLSWSGGNNACQTCSVWRASPNLPHQNPTVEADSRSECQANQILVKRTGILSCPWTGENQECEGWRPWKSQND